MKVEMPDPTIAAIASAQQSSKVTSPIQAKLNEKPAVGASDQVSLNNAIPRHTVETIQRIGNLGDTLNFAAGTIRKTDQNLGIAKDMIDKMNGSLDLIIKNFPPFSTESKERQDILMSYASIRKEILRLTFPAPPPDSWQGVPLSAGGKMVTPDLTTQSTDSDITTAQQQLGSLSGQISSVRKQNGVKG